MYVRSRTGLLDVLGAGAPVDAAGARPLTPHTPVLLIGRVTATAVGPAHGAVIQANCKHKTHVTQTEYSTFKTSANDG